MQRIYGRWNRSSDWRICAIVRRSTQTCDSTRTCVTADGWRSQVRTRQGTSRLPVDLDAVGMEAASRIGGRCAPSQMESGLLVQRSSQVQDVGRLLSTRHRWVSLAGRGRLVVPEGFREFLGVEPGGTVIVVGAAVCIELWQPSAWHAFITAEMPQFRQQLGELIG